MRRNRPRLQIAVAMFGIPRATEICAPSIEQNILDPLRECGDVSVHYHLYHQSHVVNPRSGEAGVLSPDNYDYFRQFQGRLASPEEAFQGGVMEEWCRHGDAFADGFNSLRNLRSQLWSLLQVSIAVEAASPDVVVFLRPDLEYASRLDGTVIRFAARHPNACVIPDWQWWHGYNDRFAVCGADSYWAYGSRISQALAFCRDTGEPLHSERLLRFALRRARCKVRLLNLLARRVRLGGGVVEEDFETGTLRGNSALRLEHWYLALLSKSHW